ncbi:MAG: DUF4397 domain-containing protein [Granulicella sp.]
MPASSLNLARQAKRAAALALGCAVLTGCQSFRPANPSAMVRIIDVSPDAPALDMYQGDNAVAYNLNFGTVTSYVPIAPGNSTFMVAPAGSRQALSSIQGTFTAGTLYTVLVDDSATNLQQVILTDRVQAAASKASTAPSVRLIHQAPRIGAVDIYLVPAGKRLSAVRPVVSNLAPGSSTGYLVVPNCICAAVMVPAGTAPRAGTASHIETQANYGSGTARTLILLDPPATSSSGLQVITTVDADPIN